MYNITKHARERWQQRVNPTSGINTEDQIRQAVENSEYIGDDSETGNSFYINSDHWIFCIDTKKQNVVTVFEADFGFDQDINRDLADKLLKKIRKMRNEIDKVKIRNEETIQQLIYTKEVLEREIELKEAELRKTEAQINNINAGLKVKEKEFESVFKQLIYSVAFRKEQLVLKNAQ